MTSERNGEKKLRAFLADEDSSIDFHFERMAVTREQIAELGLPTRPTKARSESGRLNPHLRSGGENGRLSRAAALTSMPSRPTHCARWCASASSSTSRRITCRCSK
jgi:hypothetical protein